jgi:hypothetical protein
VTVQNSDSTPLRDRPAPSKRGAAQMTMPAGIFCECAPRSRESSAFLRDQMDIQRAILDFMRLNFLSVDERH